jgi:hypothetical protein
MEKESCMKQPTVQTLLDELKNTPPGPIEAGACDKIINLLAACWSELKGANDTSMAAWKLHRAEDLSWNPPVLSFMIERHGATVLGSSRAELHEWTVNLDLETAGCAEGRYRQLRPTAPRLNVKPIVARVCDAVQQGPAATCELVKDGIVVWNGDNRLSIKHGALIPGGGYEQTVAGRRRRFRNELECRMKDIGWEFVDVKRTMEFRKIA